MDLGKLVLVLLAGMGIVGLLEHVPGKEPAPPADPPAEPTARRLVVEEVRVVKRRKPLKPTRRKRKPPTAEHANGKGKPAVAEPDNAEAGAGAGAGEGSGAGDGDGHDESGDG